MTRSRDDVTLPGPADIVQHRYLRPPAPSAPGTLIARTRLLCPRGDRALLRPTGQRSVPITASASTGNAARRILSSRHDADQAAGEKSLARHGHLLRKILARRSARSGRGPGSGDDRKPAGTAARACRKSANTTVHRSRLTRRRDCVSKPLWQQDLTTRSTPDS